MMKTRILLPFLMTAILSACASTNDGKTADAQNSEEKTYVVGSHLPTHSGGSSATQSVSGQDAASLQRGAGGVTPAGAHSAFGN